MRSYVLCSIVHSFMIHYMLNNIEIQIEKNKDWLSLLASAGVLFLFVMLLSLGLGPGLLVSVTLYLIGRYVYTWLSKYDRPLWMKKGLFFFIMGLFIALVFLLFKTGVEYGVSTLQEESSNIQKYIKLAILDAKSSLPSVIANSLPTTPEQWDAVSQKLSAFVGQHALGWSGHWVSLFFQFMFAAIIALSLSSSPRGRESQSVVSTIIQHQFVVFSECFKRLLGAQVYVAIWNAFCTAIFVFMILPSFDIVLPFRGLLVGFTLCISIIPALGNVVANGVMALLCLPYGIVVVVGALCYLILAHKVEYIINARIIGKHVRSSIPEMLVALIVGEKLFGLPGLMLGPVLYAFVKAELFAKKII